MTQSNAETKRVELDKVPDSGMADTGVRNVYATGAMRERAQGKGRYDLISPEFMHRLAVRLEQGTIKYSVRNWEKGFSCSETLDSTIRHLYQYLQGELSEDHLAAAAFGIMCVCQFEERNPEQMDIPTRPEYKYYLHQQEVLKNGQ